ncbi:helix-turn-helix domain-containing protein [Alphaproteobacteria bacterium LSUCC0719]|jgi:transcriptional regulator with XRE-family HTH domain
MTPFGERMRVLRAARGLTQQQQADQLGVSKAYISALENGARGRPSAPFVDQICAWLGLIWDDAEDLKALAARSHPKPTIDASRSHAGAVELANLMATHIGSLDRAACQRLIEALRDEVRRSG